MAHEEPSMLTSRDAGMLIVLAGVFASSIVMANVLAGVKLEVLGVLLGIPLIVPAGTIAYAWTFPITDIVDEVYGKKHALYIVWAGLAAEISMLILIAIDYPIPAATPEMQELYVRAFALQPRIVAASIAAYIIAQHHDVWAFWKWREITRGRYLWVRNNASTIVSQLIDSIVFTTLAFAGITPLTTLLSMILTVWAIKVAIALLDTPFVYLGVILIGRASKRIVLGEASRR